MLIHFLLKTLVIMASVKKSLSIGEKNDGCLRTVTKFGNKLENCTANEHLRTAIDYRIISGSNYYCESNYGCTYYYYEGKYHYIVDSWKEVAMDGCLKQRGVNYEWFETKYCGY